MTRYLSVRLSLTNSTQDTRPLGVRNFPLGMIWPRATLHLQSRYPLFRRTIIPIEHKQLLQWDQGQWRLKVRCPSVP